MTHIDSAIVLGGPLTVIGLGFLALGFGAVCGWFAP